MLVEVITDIEVMTGKELSWNLLQQIGSPVQKNRIG